MIDILIYFPIDIKNILCDQIKKGQLLEEIRIRVNKPIILKFSDKEIIVKYFVSRDDILKILQCVCENSIYSYQHQIAEGFITVKGGHRVGIAGSCVIENEKVININYINSLNFRIARQIIGVSKPVLKDILNTKENTIFNTLIISKPGCGKTTLIKDIIKEISSGIEEINFKGLNVAVVDERGEIAALYKGSAQNDIGLKTDVIDNVSKSIGMKMLIRSMAPQVIVADEIGGVDDIEAINYAMCSGSKGIFSAHGQVIEDLYANKVLKELIDDKIFEVLIFLDSTEKGKIKEVFILDKIKQEYKRVEGK